MTVVVVPAAVLLLRSIRQHYWKLNLQVGQPLELQANQLQPLAVIIPIKRWDRVSEKAMHFAMLLSSDITAVHVSDGTDDKDRFRQLWVEKVEKPACAAIDWKPRLEIILFRRGNERVVVVNTPWRLRDI